MRGHPTIVNASVNRASRFASVRALLAGFALLFIAGCMTDPAAPLIPTPQRQATVLPTDVQALDADGYPNVLSDPSTVPGLPRTARSIEASEADLEAERRASQAAVAGIRQPSFAASLARQGRTHAAEAQRAIEATGRPSVPGVQDAALYGDAAAAAGTLGGAAAPAAPADLGRGPVRPLDPDAPRPRPVGVPPFRGTPNSD